MLFRVHAAAMIAALLLAAGLTTSSSAQPFRGPAADRDLREHGLMMRTPFTALWLVPRPGAEDFQAMAALRVLGGMPVIVYASNGEAAPTHAEQGPLLLAAAVRKEEADAAAEALGGSAWYLNLPDRAGDWNTITPGSDSYWAGASDSLAVAIRTFRPAIAVVVRDHATGVGSPAETEFLARLLGSAMGTAADARRVLNGPIPLAGKWGIAMAFVDAADGSPVASVPASVKEDVKKRVVGARTAYRSLEGLLATPGSSSYSLVAEGGKTVRMALGSSIGISSPTLAPLLGLIKKASDAIVARRSGALAAVDRARTELSSYLQPRVLSQLSDPEARTLGLWKGELDLVKALLLKAPLSVTVSDSVLVDRQMFMLEVTGADSVTLPGTTGIVFHQPRNEEWIINISMVRQFDLHAVREFKVITPDKNPKSFPVAENGMTRSILRTPFRFSVFHQSASMERSFIVNYEPRLGFAPRWGTVIHTPVVCTDPADPIIIEVHNYSRDPGHPSYLVRDSICGGSAPTVDLQRKGDVAFDTLEMHWDVPDDSIGQDHPFVLRSGKTRLATILGRPLGLRGDSSARVCVLGPQGGIVDRAVRRVRGPMVWPAEAALDVGALDSSTVAIIDAEAVRAIDGRALSAWVRRGGHAVVLAESPGAWAWTAGRDSLWVERQDPLSSHAGVSVADPSAFPELNPLQASDWDNWPTHRARATVRWTGSLAPRVLLTAAGSPVAVTWTEGRGRVTVLSLTMRPALRELHRGSHRLLAELVSLRP